MPEDQAGDNGLSLFPGLIALTDVSEQPHFSCNMEKTYYSTKAKTHTVKV